MSKQIRDFIITILIVTFVFAFNDEQSVFQFNSWLTNFFSVGLGVILVVLAHYFGHKWAAKHYSVEVVHKIWGISRFGFAKKAHLSSKGRSFTSLPVGAILAIIISFLSNGRFFFIPIEAIDIKGEEHKRMGRWRLKVLEREIARIAFAGPAANMLFAFILQFFNGSGMFSQLILMNCLYALYHMIPWSQLDGAKIFFGSLYLYIFGASFLILSFLMLTLLPTSIAFALSILGAIIIFVTFFLKVHLGK